MTRPLRDWHDSPKRQSSREIRHERGTYIRRAFKNTSTIHNRKRKGHDNG